MNKFSDNILKNTEIDVFKEHVDTYARDLIDDNYCKQICNIEITDYNKNNIKELIIKYINCDNKNVTRKTQIQKKEITKLISKSIYDRKFIKPFGKALNDNNMPTRDKEIQIIKTVSSKKINNDISKKKKLENKKPITKQKYKPPTTNSTNINVIKKNKYVPPTRTANKSIPSNKLKIMNIPSDTTVEELTELCNIYAKVLNCYIPKFNYGKKKGKNKDFAIVKFNTGIERDKCINEINDMKFNNMILKVEKYN